MRVPVGRAGGDERDVAGLGRLERELAGASSKASMAERLGSKVKNERSEVAMQVWNSFPSRPRRVSAPHLHCLCWRWSM